MRPPVAYYGGKSRMAPWIVTLLPPHRVYVEPFCGSAAVLFAKAPATHEVLNDRYGDVVHFLRMLRDRPDDLEMACGLTPYARDEYEAADLEVEDLDDIERARRWWVRSSQSFGQMAKVGTGWSTSIQRGSNNARSAWNRIERFAACALRLGCVAIENRDAFEVIEAYDDPDGVMYLDPPYLGTTRSSFGGGPRGNGYARRPRGDYAAEFHSEDDHRALADVARAVKATVLLSGYPSELYDSDLYTDWHRVERRVLCRAGNGLSPDQHHRTEVIWSNRPLVRDGLFDDHTLATTGRV